MTSVDHGGFESSPAHPDRRRLVQPVLASVVTVLVLLLAGSAMGVVWAAVSPHLDLKAVATGSETAFDTQLTADLLLALIGAVVGLFAGPAAWWAGRRHRVVVVVTLAVAGVLAGLVAADVGHLVRQPELLDQLPHSVPASTLSLIDFRVRLHAAVLVLPLVAVTMFGLLELVKGERPAPPADQWTAGLDDDTTTVAQGWSSPAG